MGNLCYKNNIKLENDLNLIHNNNKNTKINKTLYKISWLNNFTIIKKINKSINSYNYLVKRNKKFYILKIIIWKKWKNCLIESEKEERIILKLTKKNKHFISIIKNYRNKESNFYLMPYASSGSLLDFLILKKIKFNYKQIIYILYFLFQCIFFWNKNNILYNNLKLENILIDSNFNFKLSDFNLCWKTNKNFNKIDEELNYFSPEKILNKKLNIKSDIWSIGVIAFILLFNQSPFDNNDKDKIINKIISCNYSYPNKIDFKFDKFFKDVFKFNTNCRLGNNMEEINNHILFQDYTEKEFKKDLNFNIDSKINWIMTDDINILENYKNNIKSEQILYSKIKFNRFTYN